MKKTLLVSICALTLSCSSTNTTTLADVNATIETKELISFLHKVSDSGQTMFGHQDATVYGIGWEGIPGDSDVKRVTGDYPAVYGWELGHIELGNDYSLDSVKFSKIREEIILADQRGGINTVSWHLRNPLNGGSSWDMTKGSVSAILNDEAVQQKYISGLDILCDFVLSLKDGDGNLIPILFRPFHEHTGSWFWWGADFCTPDEYIALWKLTQDYITTNRGIHNLAYVYSPSGVGSVAEYFERYPGDDCVDVLGLDSYHRGGVDGVDIYTTTVSSALAFIEEQAQIRNKPFAFSETGLSEITMDNWYTEVLYPIIEKTHPAYVLVWRNAINVPNHYYAPYPGHPAAADFVEFKNLPNILFEGEL